MEMRNCRPNVIRTVVALSIVLLCAMLGGCAAFDTKGKFDNALVMTITDDKAFSLSIWFNGLFSFGNELRASDAAELKRLKKLAAKAEAEAEASSAKK